MLSEVKSNSCLKIDQCITVVNVKLICVIILNLLDSEILSVCQILSLLPASVDKYQQLPQDPSGEESKDLDRLVS